MSETDDFFDGGEAPESDGASKKRGGGIGNLLPAILKYVAIGLGALIFIVTVSVITYNIMNKGGRNQTVVSDPSSPYVGRRPEYGYYDSIGSINVRTRDFPISYNVRVDMIIGYELGDQNASQELSSRRHELQDFTRRFFSGKTAAELAHDREESLKNEIREILNTRFLDSRGARVILFRTLDVMSSDF